MQYCYQLSSSNTSSIYGINRDAGLINYCSIFSTINQREIGPDVCKKIGERYCIQKLKNLCYHKIKIVDSFIEFEDIHPQAFGMIVEKNMQFSSNLLHAFSYYPWSKRYWIALLSVIKKAVEDSPYRETERVEEINTLLLKWENSILSYCDNSLGQTRWHIGLGIRFINIEGDSGLVNILEYACYMGLRSIVEVLMPFGIHLQQSHKRNMNIVEQAVRGLNVRMQNSNRQVEDVVRIEANYSKILSLARKWGADFNPYIMGLNIDYSTDEESSDTDTWDVSSAEDSSVSQDYSDDKYSYLVFPNSTKLACPQDSEIMHQLDGFGAYEIEKKDKPKAIKLIETIRNSELTEEDCLEVIKTIIQEYPQWVNLRMLEERDQEVIYDVSLLMHSAAKGYLKIVQWLVEQEANMYIVDSQYRTALTYAIENHQEAVATYLIEQGIGVNTLYFSADKEFLNDHLPLYKALVSGQDKVVKTLLDYHVDTFFTNYCFQLMMHGEGVCDQWDLEITLSEVNEDSSDILKIAKETLRRVLESSRVTVLGKRTREESLSPAKRICRMDIGHLIN